MAIQQHPIPQNVTAYQFRLVGDMTLKQFFQLAGGIVVGLIFYATGLPFFFKWPLVAIAVGLGAGMAFLPVQGRPMDQWLIAFFRSIYQPTIFTWEKAKELPPEPTPPVPATQPTSPSEGGNLTPTTATEPTQTASPTLNTDPVVAAQAAPGVPPAATTPAPTTPPTSPEPTQPVAAPSGNVTVQDAPIQISRQETAATSETNVQKPTEAVTAVPTAQTARPQTQASTSTPVFSSNLPIPSTPQTPNTVVGMTLTPDGKILEGAIVEIRLEGATVRATKSNKLGQFMFLKALDNNTYQLTAEKDGFTFPTFSLVAAGNVILPIKLQATGAAPAATAA
jgi:hypothetical protein